MVMDGLDEIRNGEQQFARGTIKYPDGRLGYLIADRAFTWKH